MTAPKSFKTHIVRIGNSSGVRIPKGLLEQVGLSTKLLQAGDVGPQVELTAEAGTIVIRHYRDLKPSFEELVGPLLEKVSVAPPEGQLLVLHAIAGTVDWLARAKRAVGRLVPALQEIYLQHSHEIEELKERGLRLWERDDLMWFLLYHSFVTSALHLDAEPPLSYEEVLYIAHTTEDPAQEIVKKLRAREGIVLVGHERAEALLDWCLMMESEGGIDAVNERFKSLANKRAMQEFLDLYATDKDRRHGRDRTIFNPVDQLYAPVFADQFTVHQFPDDQFTLERQMMSLLSQLDISDLYIPPKHRAFSIGSSNDADQVDGNGANSNSKGNGNGQSPYEKFYRQVAQQAKIEPWTLEQLVVHYKGEIVQSLDAHAEAEPDTRATAKSLARQSSFDQSVGSTSSSNLSDRPPGTTKAKGTKKQRSR